MRRMKTRAGRSRPVESSSSSSDDDVSLGASQEEAPTPPAPSTDVASSSDVSHRRSGVPSKRNQFTRQYEAQWKDDLSMFTNIEAARVISSAFKASMEIPLFQWSQISRHPEWMPQINAWFRRFEHRFYWDDEHDTVVRRVWENHAVIRLRDFWYDTQKKAKKTARDKGFQGWNDVVVWRDFKPIYIPEDIWLHYLQHVTSERFTRRSQSGAGNRNRPIHGSVTTHTGGSVPFSAHAKRMVRLI
ncbi:hypothetical protein NC652_031299 [Populus alba x Populus x berolinensis]|nr:hypothetical protein NC652_031299 [Populus alba x Populus x berolinensis]